MILRKKKLALTTLIAGMGLCILLAMQGVAHAVLFSLDPNSPSVLGGGFSAADIFTQTGPIGGPPTRAFPAAILGLVPGDDIDAIDTGPFTNAIPFFSVDRPSAGVAGTPLAVEAGVGQAAGDIYNDPTFFAPPGTNALSTNQAALGLLPAVPPGTPAMPPIDNIDALDMDIPSLVDTNGDGIPNLPILFSLAAGSPSLGAGGVLAGGSPADIFVTVGGGPPAVALTAAQIGFGAGDDVDALVLLGPPLPVAAANNLVVSLIPGSPALGPLGLTAADIFDPVNAAIFFGPSSGGVFASNLGLLLTDDINAFSDSPTGAIGVIPEPSTLLLLASGLVGMGTLTRKRTRPKGA